jgi:predicted site-specific integrase-resolvase
MKKNEETITVPEFAEQVGVNRVTVSRWVQAGLVKGSKSGPFPGKTSRILIPVSELHRVLKLMDGESNGHSKSS